MHRYIFSKKNGVILYILLAPLSALSSIAVAVAMAAATDYAIGGNLDDIWKYLIFFGIYMVLDFLIDTSFEFIRAKLVKKTMCSLLSDIYRKISLMPASRFSQRNSADYIANLTSDMDVLRDNYFTVLLNIYTSFLRFASASILLFWISPLLGLFVLATSILQTTVPFLYAKSMEAAGAKYSNAQEKHMQIMKENLSAFLTGKIFHLENRLYLRYRMAMEDAEESRRHRDALKALSSNVSFVFSTITYLGVFLLGAVLTLMETISLAEVIAASQLILYISNPIYYLNMNLSELRTAKISAKKLQELLDEPEDLGGDEILETVDGSLSVRNLRFSYGQREILSGFTYDFQPGKKYLITGVSGSGKSTLLTLLAGLRGDYEGNITLSGKELRQLSRESLSKHICAITQEPFLFDGTLYDNVTLYEDMDESDVIVALHRAELEGFLSTLSQGIRTPLGENAAAMSGGEKQRLVIARALVRKTPILLLDESTSHLDPATAAEIEHLVLGLQDVTVLLVSHNASEDSRECFDVVLEMTSGRLQEISMQGP